MAKKQKFKHTGWGWENAAGSHQRLNQIDRLIDWEKFDKYLRWLESPDLNRHGHPPLKLFKAMLLQQWFALNAYEFERDIDDRLSFRRFVGLGFHDHPPDHETVCAFRRLLLDRGVSQDVANELQAQLIGLGKVRRDYTVDASLGVDDFPSLAVTVGDEDIYGPRDWERLEQRLVDYWRGKCRGRIAPHLEDIKLSDEPGLRPYLTLVRVTTDNRFCYEFLGEEIERSNAGRLLGAVLEEKAAENQNRFGHVGLQGELLALCRRAVSRCAPVSTSTFYTNAGGVKCQIWTVLTPLLDDKGAVAMLLGAALIKAVTIN